MSNNIKAPCRYDFVGSFLRPDYLKKARADFEKGAITAQQLKEVEDKAILDLVAKQKKAGYHIITDGEFRRATWHLDFMWGFNGVGHSKTQTGLPFHGEAAMIDDTYLTGKVSVGDHPFVENTKKYYNDTEELVQDIAKGYRKVIADLYAAGCRNIQFDDCSWGMIVDPNAKAIFEVDDAGLEDIKRLLLRINNLAIEGKPEDLVITTHVCRGNFHSTYASSGAYDSVAETLFAGENVSAYYLEFDDERSGGFEPLKAVSGDKKVVLGLITSKKPELEDKQTVIDRIHDAAKYISLDRLCLSPQCGFASCEIGNKLTEEEQWAKLALVKEIAEEVWG